MCLEPFTRPLHWMRRDWGTIQPIDATGGVGYNLLNGQQHANVTAAEPSRCREDSGDQLSHAEAVDLQEKAAHGDDRRRPPPDSRIRVGRIPAPAFGAVAGRAAAAEFPADQRAQSAGGAS